MSTSIAVADKGAIAQVEPSAMEMLSMALNSGASAEVIKAFVELQQSVERFAWEREERQARINFDDALSRCQSKITTVVARRDGDGGKYKFENYDDLDKVVRPIYVAEGFSISYGEADCPTQGKTRFVAYLRRSGITREYFKDMTASTLGPKGTPVMTQINAEASLDSYAKRYLLRDIFNIAIGKDDDDGKGGVPPWLIDHLSAIDSANDAEALNAIYSNAYKSALKVGDRKAMGELMFRRDSRLAFLKRGAQ